MLQLHLMFSHGTTRVYAVIFVRLKNTLKTNTENNCGSVEQSIFKCFFNVRNTCVVVFFLHIHVAKHIKLCLLQ